MIWINILIILILLIRCISNLKNIGILWDVDFEKQGVNLWQDL
ncbi:MAG: hypothetical protein ACTTIX_09635 [Peptoanaerobacter stomatis]